MEIIHLILGKANPDRMNGVNKVVFQLATEQAASGRSVEVWGISASPVHDYGQRNFRTLLFQAQRVPFMIDPALKAALMAKKGRIIVHLHGGWIPVYASISAFLGRIGIPFVLTPHGAYNTIAMQRSAWQKTMYFHLFEKKILRRAQRIHAIGQSEVSGLSAIFPNSKSSLLPYGYRASGDLSPQKSTNPHFTIGFIGRLDIYTKGLDLLMAAFALFYQECPSAQLWIVGDSSEKGTLQADIDQRGLTAAVRLWGSKFGEEKADLLHNMHVFAHPSRNEGLPASVLEAALAGIPCVVTRATNVAENITAYQAGIAVDDESMEGLVDAFRQLHRQWQAGTFAEMGQNAAKMVAEKYNWTPILAQFDHLYSN